MCKSNATGQMCKEVQVGQEQLGARVVKKSAKHAGSTSDFKSFFRWKVDVQAQAFDHT